MAIRTRFGDSMKWWITGFLIIVTLFILWMTRAQLADLWSLLQSRDEIVGRVQQYGVLGPLVMFILLMAQVFIPMAPGQPIMLASGYLYGHVWGSLLTAIAIFLSGEIAFIIARYVGRPAVYRLFSAKITEYWERMAAHQGVLFYVCAFILPIIPGDLLVYVAGLGNISPRRFIYANLLGRLPLSILITLLGAYHLNLPTVFWLMPAIILLLALVGMCKSLSIRPITSVMDMMWKRFSSRSEVPF